jgi:hypothetical protein
MNRKQTFLVAGALALAGILFYFYGGHDVPPGQAPLANLTAETLPSIKDAFNAAKDDVRVLLLLSPT